MSETELVARLEKLERDNRRLKRLGAAALVLAAALGLIAATRPVPDVIKAHEFDVVDNAGGSRIRMEVGPQQQGAHVTLFDAAGKRREDLNVNDAGIAGILLLDSRDYGAVTILHVPAVLSDVVNRNEITLARPGSEVGFPPIGVAIGVSNSGAPAVTLSDPQGFSMDLGSTSTQTPTTGATQQTSAASIVMFGNDKQHHVIWQAP